MPVSEITAVPPAATSGWYPIPSEEPTLTRTPPLGSVPTFRSALTEEAVPVNVTSVVVAPSARL